MIHICRSAKTKQFYVVVLGDNGELLNNTELLTTKANCYKNIRAAMKNYDGQYAQFQDDTLKKPQVYLISRFSAKINKTAVKPHPIYTPSKKK